MTADERLQELKRGECPSHGATVGFVSPADQKAWCTECQEYIVAVIVEYVPRPVADALEGQLAYALDALEGHPWTGWTTDHGREVLAAYRAGGNTNEETG